MIRKWMERLGLAAFLLLVLSSFTLSSQEDLRDRRLRRSRAASLEHAADSAALPVLSDSVKFVRDSLHKATLFKYFFCFHIAK